MRHFLISALLLSLLAGCSSWPHHIDVQQGNALDQDNLARLKTGLTRSQVRFLLGTPLIVDPFRTDRWDYVYLYYKAGKLTEQKQITLFFDGDTLARIEGDLPEPAAQPVSPAEPKPESQSGTSATPAVQGPAGQSSPAAPSEPTPAAAAVAPSAQAGEAEPAVSPSASVESPPAAELSLKPETDVTQIKPDAMPSFPDAHAVPAASDDPVLKSLNAWADAWRHRDSDSYFAAYDASFAPPGGGSRAAWEARQRKVLSAAKSIAVKIASPKVERASDGTATVTFKQYYRSGNYHDAVVKQLRMVEREGRWLITDEKVLSVLKGGQP
ncbi:MAG: outer membrane protein assembly factor BamE [Hyphomicrobiaceae bacterium]